MTPAADPCYHWLAMNATRVCIHTLGCKVNQCDGDEMARALAARGYGIAAGSGAADVYVVNTCTVTHTADAKARKLVRRLARRAPDATIIVTGCWAQRDPRGVADALPEADAVVPNTRKSEIADILANFRQPGGESGNGAPRARPRAFLKIQDGCDHRCAYCIVPHVRGAPMSRGMREVLGRAEALAADGVKELVLCGIRLGAYGRDGGGGASLADLLRALRAVPIPRLRLSSIEPMDFDTDLFAEMADDPTLCHHLHVPLQSGDDAVLAAMDRGYTTADFTALVERIASVWPDAAITTDVIAGFPGETEEQFARSLAFVRETGFTRLHVFPYSSRPGTPAAARPNRVAPQIVRHRAERMLELADDLAAAAARRWAGEDLEVLFEERGRDGALTGLTPHYVRVHCPGPEEWIGRIVTVAGDGQSAGELVAKG